MANGWQQIPQTLTRLAMFQQKQKRRQEVDAYEALQDEVQAQREFQKWRIEQGLIPLEDAKKAFGDKIKPQNIVSAMGKSYYQKPSSVDVYRLGDGGIRRAGEVPKGSKVYKDKDKNILSKMPPKSRREGFFDWGKPNINEPTFNVMQNVSSMEDIEELRQNWKEYEKEGVDVQQIIKYFVEEK